MSRATFSMALRIHKKLSQTIILGDAVVNAVAWATASGSEIPWAELNRAEGKLPWTAIRVWDHYADPCDAEELDVLLQTLFRSGLGDVSSSVFIASATRASKCNALLKAHAGDPQAFPVNAHARSVNGHTALTVAVSHGIPPDSLRRVLELSSSCERTLNARDESGRTALAWTLSGTGRRYAMLLDAARDDGSGLALVGERSCVYTHAGDGWSTSPETIGATRHTLREYVLHMCQRNEITPAWANQVLLDLDAATARQMAYSSGITPAIASALSAALPVTTLYPVIAGYLLFPARDHDICACAHCVLLGIAN
jgi:hypothetical protein